MIEPSELRISPRVKLFSVDKMREQGLLLTPTKRVESSKPPFYWMERGKLHRSTRNDFDPPPHAA